MENPYADLLKTETTNFLYDGMNVLNEYGEKGEPLAQYYTVNGQVLAKQMFGFHGRKQEGYEGNIRTRGGLMYYQQDALGNVMDVTDRIGDTVMKYRYDAFGNLFTQMAAPYNTVGFTGKSYDAKASLMDYSARWYSPNYGRFITEDTFFGWMDEPLSLNKYSYVHNNPIKYIDPTGNAAEVQEPGGGGSGTTPNPGPSPVRDVPLYIDGNRSGSVKLYSDGKTYFSDMRPVRSFFESMGYTVKWNDGVYVYKNEPPSNGGGGGGSGGSGSTEPTTEEKIADRDTDFGNQAGLMPTITKTYNIFKSETTSSGLLGSKFKLEGSVKFEVKIEGQYINYNFNDTESISFSTSSGAQVQIDKNGKISAGNKIYQYEYDSYEDIVKNIKLTLAANIEEMGGGYIKILEGTNEVSKTFNIDGVKVTTSIVESVSVGIKEDDLTSKIATALIINPYPTAIDDTGKIFPEINLNVPYSGDTKVRVPLGQNKVGETIIVPPTGVGSGIPLPNLQLDIKFNVPRIKIPIPRFVPIPG